MAEHALPKVGWGEVVGVAAQVISERGLTNLTLADLADQLEVDESAVTYWFQDPGQVLVAVMEIRNNWFLDEVRTRMTKLDTQTERLREFLEMSAADHQATFWIELWRLSSRDDSARRARQAMADAVRRTIAGIIRAGQRTGEFGAASPDKVALVLAALISGFSVNVTLGDPAVTPEVMLDTLLDASERLLGAEFAPRAE
jgi:TetR/AcrR family transcriptional repressor of nem operon